MNSNKVRLNIKALTGYILTALIAAGYMFLYDKGFGVSFLAVLAAAPFISYFLIRGGAGKIYVNAALSNTAVYKDEMVEITVTLENYGFFPVPFLFLKFFNDLNLNGLTENQYTVSLSKGKPCIITKSYKAEIWGSALLGISEIAALDYLGLFKIAISDNLPLKVDVCPSIPESRTNELITDVYNEIISSEDKTDEKEQSFKQSFESLPGYEHRPYVPGDALKRINWKLSARTDKYMVREYEPSGLDMPVILLDRRGRRLIPNLSENGQKAAMLSEERIIEAVLAMLSSMCKHNMACRVYCFFENTWREFIIEEESDILAIQDAFSRYKFMPDNEIPAKTRIPADVIKENNTSMMIFTCALDLRLCEELSDASSIGMTVKVVCSNISGIACDDMWIVNEAYDFYAAQ